MNDLVQQIVVQICGRWKTQELHSEWGDETQYNSCSAQDDEDQKVGVVLWSKQHKSIQRDCFSANLHEILISS